MIYTARYAHLKELPKWKVGDTIKPMQKGIATMGNTGQSTAAHVHFDIIRGIAPKHVYRLYEVADKIDNTEQLLRQYIYFLDNSFFGIEPEIMTYFGDPDYFNSEGNWKFHPAYDLVPTDRKKTNKHFPINWNRTRSGTVSGVGFDETGYGYYLTVQYEV